MTDNELDPIEGNWYYDTERRRDFTVVTVDEEEEVIEIQYQDGDLEELDFDEWAELDLELTEPPEDWRGPLDGVDAEDMGYED